MARNKNGPWSPIYGQAWTHQQTRRSSAVVRERVKRPTTAEVAPFLVLGWLNRINIWCLANNEQGGIAGLSDVMLAAVAWPEAIEEGRKPAEVGASIRASLHGGDFLEGTGEAEKVHNFGRHHARLLRDREYRRDEDESDDRSSDQSPDQSPDQSDDTVPKRTVPKRTEEENHTGAGSAPGGQAKSKSSPAESAAKLLAATLGSGINICRKQVSALRTAGWGVEAILVAIREHGEPGLEPWNWTKRATGALTSGAAKPGAKAAQILAWGDSDGGRKERA